MGAFHTLGWPAVAASLSLVGLVLVLASWLRLGIQREILGAAVRAAAQLLAVGVVFAAIFRSSAAMAWASAWVAGMVVVATLVVRRRVGVALPHLTAVTGAVIALATIVTLVVIFGFGVFDLDPVSFVVVGGITVGNAVPASVLGAKQAMTACRDGWGQIEALLALDFDEAKVTRFMAPRAARAALVPQIERTKVVGLIALPGAMVGLLLAGVAPIDAVVIQLLVMYLVLGTAALCIVGVVVAITRASVTDDLRAADWIRPGWEPAPSARRPNSSPR